MLKYRKLPPREARRAWPKNETTAVACETSLRDIGRAGITGLPHLPLPGKRGVRCLYCPAENKILVDRGFHVQGEVSEANGSGGKESLFPGFFLVGA